MGNGLRIGVKFCGNCNPCIDTKHLMSILIDALKDEVNFVHWEQKPYHILLIISGCNVDCATRPDFSGPTLVVAGNSLDQISLPLEKLRESLINKIKNV